MRYTFRILACSLAMLTGACAASAGARSAFGGNVITRTQIESLREAQTVRQVVERLHPNWLHQRGVDTNAGTDQLVVYWDRSRMGGIEALEALRADDVGEIRFLSPAEATNRFGAGHLAGAIVVMPRTATS